MFDNFGGFLFIFVAILVTVLTRFLNKSGERSRNRSKQPLSGQIRAAVERATSVPPMTSGQYVVPNQPPPSWQAPPPGWQAPPPGWPQPVPPPMPPPQQQQQRARPSVADLNAQVQELMAANREVAAVRLLCDEADLGIIEAQQYARELSGRDSPEPPPAAEAPVNESAYVGSAAFATSIFETGEDEGWASGWTDAPEPEDRSDIDELWRTVREGANPASAGNQAGDRP